MAWHPAQGVLLSPHAQCSLDRVRVRVRIGSQDKAVSESERVSKLDYITVFWRAPQRYSALWATWSSGSTYESIFFMFEQKYGSAVRQCLGQTTGANQ